MNSLVLDLAALPMVAVIKGEKEFYFKHEGKGADNYMELIDRALKQSGLSFADIDNVCVNIGPGSFTGERTAVSIAKGLCYNTNKQLLCFNSFDLFASGKIKVLKGFSNMVYICDQNNNMDCVTISSLAGKSVGIIEPELAEALKNTSVKVEKVCSPSELLKKAKPVSINGLRPLYLRKSQAEIMREAAQKNAK